MSKKHKFKVENDTYEWDQPTITAADIRAAGPGIPANMDLYVKLPGSPARLVSDPNEVFDLSEPGIEKFFAQNAASEAGAN